MMLTRSLQLCRAQSNTHEIAAFFCVCVVGAILSLSPSCSHMAPENRTVGNRQVLGDLPKISRANRRQSEDLHPGLLVGFPLCLLGQVSDHSPSLLLRTPPCPRRRTEHTSTAPRVRAHLSEGLLSLRWPTLPDHASLLPPSPRSATAYHLWVQRDLLLRHALSAATYTGRKLAVVGEGHPPKHGFPAT